jgi:hypothetical protein
LVIWPAGPRETALVVWFPPVSTTPPVVVRPNAWEGAHFFRSGPKELPRPTISTMCKELTRGELLVGAAGLGLLRLHRSGDASTAGTIRDELVALPRRIDEPPNNQDALERRST